MHNNETIFPSQKTKTYKVVSLRHKNGINLQHFCVCGRCSAQNRKKVVWLHSAKASNSHIHTGIHSEMLSYKCDKKLMKRQILRSSQCIHTHSRGPLCGAIASTVAHKDVNQSHHTWPTVTYLQCAYREHFTRTAHLRITFNKQIHTHTHSIHNNDMTSQHGSSSSRLAIHTPHVTLHELFVVRAYLYGMKRKKCRKREATQLKIKI